MRRLSAALLAFVVTACAGRPPVEVEQLPDSPIALVYLTPEQGRDLSELLTRQMRARAGATGTPGVARFDDLEAFFREPQEFLPPELLGEPSLLEPRTQERTPLAAIAKGGSPLEWSLDRSRLLFTAPRYDVLQVHELDLASGRVRRLTQGPAAHPTASLAPDGRLVYTEITQQPGGKVSSRLYVTNEGGGDPRPITAGPHDFDPVFSPDGSMVVYQTMGKDGAQALAVQQPVGAPPRLLTRGRDPVFTPDGQWIVYSQKLGSGFRLARMRPDGSGKLPVGPAPQPVGDELAPTVSPDGRYVAYVAEEMARRSLRVRRLDGSGDRPLLERGDAAVPTW